MKTLRMKPILFLLYLFCAGVLSRLLTTHHKYHLIQQSMTWSAAQNYCRVLYTDLATVVTDDDWLRLNRKITAAGLSSPVWIGLYNDIDSWKWSFEDIPLKNSTWIQWNPGQPDNAGGRKGCEGMGPWGYWWDAPCVDLHPVVCYNANYTDSSKFVGVTTPLSWPDAQAYCRQYYTDMAFIIDKNDQQLVNDVTAHQGWSWIGLYRDKWKWSDETNVTSILWLPSSPDNYNGIENCAAVTSGGVDDRTCSLLFNFFCHTLPAVMEQQVLRLQVKSDESVFNPAVQTSMLELIQQKLEEYSMMENTTVSWRLQADGEIFEKQDKNRTFVVIDPLNMCSP